MKRLTLIATAFLLAFALPMETLAQEEIRVAPRLGIDFGDVQFNSQTLFLGADARVETEALPVVINPTFDYYFVGSQTIQAGTGAAQEVGSSFFSLSANGLYPFTIDNPSFAPYAGAGLGIYRSATEEVTVNTAFGSQTLGGGSSTDVGLNLIAGVEFPTESFTPFAEAQYTTIFADVGSPDLFNLKGGVLFSF